MATRTNRDFDAFELSEARKEMLEQKAAIVAAMPGWRPENWAELKAPERWELLNQTERAFADIEKREALTVSPLGPDIYKMCEEGGIDLPQGVTKESFGNPLGIEINPELVEDRKATPDRLMQTYFHEEHHVEQMAAIRSHEANPQFSTQLRDGWNLDRNTERVSQYHREIPNKEYRDYAHEQSAELESTRLYARCMNKMYPERDAKDADSWDKESSSSLERFVRDRSDDQTKTDRDDHGFSSRLEEFVYEPYSKTKDEPSKQPTLEPSKHKEEQEPER